MIYNDLCQRNTYNCDMKIFVFGHTRSGSTLLQTILSRKNGLANLGEPYNNNPDVFEEIQDKDDYVLKVTSSTLRNQDPTKIPLEIYDEIYCTERNDKTSAMASSYLSKITNNYHQPSKMEFSIPIGFFYHYTKDLKKYYRYSEEIARRRPDYKRLEYKQILDMAVNEDIFSASELDYERDCKNYADMRAKMLYFMSSLEN